MRRRLAPLLAVALLVVGGGCVGVEATDASGTADVADPEARFCLTAARALNALEEGTATPSAVAALDELAAQAPEAVRREAAEVADRVRRARTDDAHGLRSGDGLRELADQFEQRVARTCDGP